MTRIRKTKRKPPKKRCEKVSYVYAFSVEESYNEDWDELYKRGRVYFTRIKKCDKLKGEVIMLDQHLLIQSITETCLERENYRGVQHWFRYKNHVWTGVRMTPRKVGSNKNHLDCNLPQSYFYNPYPFLLSYYVSWNEMKEFILRKYYQHVINSVQLLSRLKLLKGKTLGCFCHNVYKNDDDAAPFFGSKCWLPLHGDTFAFSCHNEILQYLIDVFEAEDGEENWRITNRHWDFLSQRFFGEVSLHGGDLMMYVKNPKRRESPFYDQELVEYEKLWQEKQCIKKNDAEPFDPACLCFRCRKYIFNNGEKLRSDNNLYYRSEDRCVMQTSVVTNFMAYMKKERTKDGADWTRIGHVVPSGFEFYNQC